jgi:hypothetical protein
MGKVHHHPDLVHSLDDFQAEIREAGIGPFQAPVTKQITEIVGELKTAHAQRVQRLDIVRVTLQHGSVLEVHQNGGASAVLGTLEIGRAQGKQQFVTVFFDPSAPHDELVDRCLQILPVQTLDDSAVAGFPECGENRIPAEAQRVDHQQSLVIFLRGAF